MLAPLYRYTTDHIYLKNPIDILNLFSANPGFGDHLMIMVDLNGELKKNLLLLFSLILHPNKVT